MAAVPLGDEVAVFGGRDGDGVALADLHLVSGLDLAFEAFPTIGGGPSARWAATLVHDVARGRIVLHGGTDGGVASAETRALAAAR